MKRIVNIILSVVFCFSVIISTVSFSISLPIYIRPFYYHQIEPLGIPERANRTAQEIKTAYDEVLDYLTLPNKEFRTGSFKFSTEGKDHFKDCKALFNLNISALIISIFVIIFLAVLNRKGIIQLSKIIGFGLTFISGIITLTLSFIAIPVALNFEKAFISFHHILFRDNSNWLLSAKKDGIIRALPPEFFMNCAILIGASIVIISLTLIILAILKRKKQST